MKLEYTAQASADFTEIAAYIAQESGYPETGEKFAEKLQSICERLATLPFNIGRRRDELKEDLYSYAFGNYLIFYTFDQEVITIITIREGHRNIEALFDGES